MPPVLSIIYHVYLIPFLPVVPMYMFACPTSTLCLLPVLPAPVQKRLTSRLFTALSALEQTPSMPPSKPKASELAAEAKRVWFPYILRTFIKDPQTSYAYLDSCLTKVDPSKRSPERTRVAVMEGDPVTLALGWYQDAIRNPMFRHCQPIPVVNMANENRAGGDWESGTLAPEECFARRSNLVQALTMPWKAHTGREESYYPIPQRGGIYSPLVCTYIHCESLLWLTA